MAANKLNVFLCLTVLTFTSVFEEKPFISEYDTGIQAVTSLSHGNTSEDPDLCLLKPAKKISHDYCQDQYSFHNSYHKYSNQLPKSARAPPLV